MSSLSPRLQVRVQQKQILTPGLVQMVSLLQLNKLELKEMISAEIAQNPVLEESADGVEELSAEELQPLLEAERLAEPADQSILDVTSGTADGDGGEADAAAMEAAALGNPEPAMAPVGVETPNDPTGEVVEQKATADPFDEIDFGTYFDEYLDPGYKSPASENVEKPSFETFLSSPETLSGHLHDQLALVALSEEVRDAAETIIGNLNENGYLTLTPEELGSSGNHAAADVTEALRVVHTLDPAGVGAADLRECLLLQLESRGGKGGVAWQVVFDHLKLVELRQFKEIARLLRRPLEHVQVAVDVIKHLDPRPGLRYSGPGARQVEPDVYISKDGEDYLISVNDEDVPQLRLNPQYRRMLDRDQEPNRDVRNYVKERYASAIQLMKNIEQRKQTILRVCQSVVRRQMDFLEHGIDLLKPMMIKEVAEEIGVHPSTVSRAVSNKYAHTPQGVFELRYFFSEAVQGPSGGATPLLILKRRVKKMIEEEDSSHPLTDEQITERLQSEGIQVTRRTVAKYREDMRIRRHISDGSETDGGQAMKISYRGVQGELAPKIQEKLDAKFAKISKMLERRGEKEAHVVITTERHLQKAEITIQFYDHQLVGIGSNVDLFTSMSEAIEKLETQAVKLRAKWREMRRSDSPDLAEEESAAAPPPEAKQKTGERRVFRVNHHDQRKPMTLEEALLEMEDHRDYLVYRDADKECVSVLVRRRDGNFDLIES